MLFRNFFSTFTFARACVSVRLGVVFSQTGSVEIYEQVIRLSLVDLFGSVFATASESEGFLFLCFVIYWLLQWSL